MMLRNLRMLGLVTSVLMGWCATPMAGAQSACDQLGGNGLMGSHPCHLHSATATYTIDLGFPIDYPDQKNRLRTT